METSAQRKCILVVFKKQRFKICMYAGELDQRIRHVKNNNSRKLKTQNNCSDIVLTID